MAIIVNMESFFCDRVIESFRGFLTKDTLINVYLCMLKYVNNLWKYRIYSMILGIPEDFW